MQSKSLPKNSFKVIFQKHNSILNKVAVEMALKFNLLFFENIATNKFRNFICILVLQENTDLKHGTSLKTRILLKMKFQ